MAEADDVTDIAGAAPPTRHPALVQAWETLAAIEELDDKREAFQAEALKIGEYVDANEIEKPDAVDDLLELGGAHALFAGPHGRADLEHLIGQAMLGVRGLSTRAPMANGHAHANAPPPRHTEQGKRSEGPRVQLPEVLPLTIAEWEARDLPAPDLLLGDLFSTTSRAILNAPTGLGKTMFAIAVGLALASGLSFLHWTGRRPARVLYIDGEMSRRLLRQRIADAAQRHGDKPETFFALSHEDIEGFAPLNTPQGQACVDALITRLGRIDFVIFDSVMCLTVGDMKDGELWGQVMPWARALTRRAIGQLWIHHTGHDETRGYGDKTREWQMDAVIHLEPVKQEGIDVSFNLIFRKARERTPANRHDFQDAKVLLVGDVWQSEVSEAAPRPQPASPTAQKFLDALRNVLIGDGIAKLHGRPAAHVDAWKAEAVLLGLIDKDARPDSARSLFSKYRRELVAANLVACENDFSWIIR